jgi:hypothetical protein
MTSFCNNRMIAPSWETGPRSPDSRWIAPSHFMNSEYTSMLTMLKPYIMRETRNGARETAELHQILSSYASGTRGVNGEKQLKGTCFVRDCLYRLNWMIIRNGMWHCGPWDSAICSMKGALFMPLKWHISCFFHRDSTGLFSLPTEPSHATHHGRWQSGNN